MDSSSIKTLSLLRKQFNRGCVEHGLLEDGDRILVALSGGKDSMLLTRLLAERQRIFRPSISVGAAYVTMDNIPYESDHAALDAFCREEGVPLAVVHASFEDRGRQDKNPCFLCARHRRRVLFDYAVSHGFNKLALGHHQDDILVTLLMNMNYEGRIDTMRPSVTMQHYPLTVIRPLCLVRESYISQYASEAGLRGLKAVCPYDHATHRTTMKEVLGYMESVNPEARFNLWRIATGTFRGSACPQ